MSEKLKPRKEITKKINKQQAKSVKLKQYYADNDLMDEEKPYNSNSNNIKLEATDDEEEQNADEEINLEDDKSKEKLNKENMDKISDILVSMIFKNVIRTLLFLVH